MGQPRNTIVFDLDGTLVDTAADLAAATNQALEPIGRRPVTEAEVRGMIGAGFPNLIDQGLRATGGPLEGDLFDEAVAKGRAYYSPCCRFNPPLSRRHRDPGRLCHGGH